MTRLAVGAAALGVLYVLTLASTDPIDLAAGVLIGGVVLALLATRTHRPPASSPLGLARRAVWFVPFAGAVVAGVLQGTWDVALRVLRVRPLDAPGIVRVPIGERSERGVAISSLATTLSPGSVLIDVDRERGDLLVHVIDASDPDGVRDAMPRFYDRYQRRVFP